MTSLFAAALAFHNAVWRYAFALGRENVLPAALGRTGAQQHPQGRVAGAKRDRPGRHRLYAVTGQDPMARPVLLAGHYRRVRHAPAADRHRRRGRRVLRPRPARRERLAAAHRPRPGRGPAGRHRRAGHPHYATLLGVPPGSPAAWMLPGSYLAVAVIGVVWAVVLTTAAPTSTPRSGSARTPSPASSPLPPTGRRMTARPAQPRPAEPHPGRPATAADTGCAQPGHRRRLPRPAAVAVADPRPGGPPRRSCPATSGSCVEHALATGAGAHHRRPCRRRAVAARRRATRQPARRTTRPGWPRSPARGPAGSPPSTPHWNATTRPASPTTTSRSWPSTPAAKARASAPRCCAPTTPTSTSAGCPPTWRPPSSRTRQLYRRHGYVPSGPVLPPRRRARRCGRCGASPAPDTAAGTPAGGQRGGGR